MAGHLQVLSDIVGLTKVLLKVHSIKMCIRDRHKTLNYSIKAQLLPNKNWNLTLSTQMIKPEHTRINMYDAGIYYQNNRFHIEAEYLYKMYGHEAFKDVHAVNSFVNCLLYTSSCV